MKYLITCEHATNFVPLQFRSLIPKKLLKTHLAYDIGAESVARELGRLLRAPVVYGDITRLIIDLNRSAVHPNSFSKFSKGLSSKEKSKLVQERLVRYSSKVEGLLKRISKTGESITVISVHSFTPVFRGKTRRTDIGLLYRNNVEKESDFALKWQRNLRLHARSLKKGQKKQRPSRKKSRDSQSVVGFNIDRNLPYRGFTDCFINSLSDKHLKNKKFVALFIELNQKHLITETKRKSLAKCLAETIPKA